MDQIIIQDLSIYAKHGVYMEENSFWSLSIWT